MFSTKDPVRTIKTMDGIREYIHKLIGHDNWFISGSFANPLLLNPNDIDVFFNTKADYESAVAHVAMLYAANKDLVSDEVTTNAATFYLRQISLPVQFIRKSFGTVEEIFNGFDLNVCKKALLPDGTLVVHESSNQELRVESVSYDTFTRYFKYANRLYERKEITRLGKRLIDTFIGDGTMVEAYYFHHNILSMTNANMFKEVCHIDSLRTYAYEQARIHAPELLV
jgi:hypothetical protein